MTGQPLRTRAQAVENDLGAYVINTWVPSLAQAVTGSATVGGRTGVLRIPSASIATAASDLSLPAMRSAVEQAEQKKRERAAEEFVRLAHANEIWRLEPDDPERIALAAIIDQLDLDRHLELHRQMAAVSTDLADPSKLSLQIYAKADGVPAHARQGKRLR